MKCINFLYRMKPLSGFILFLFLALFSLSCNTKAQNIPYKVGASFSFEISVITGVDTIIKDTLILQVERKGLIGRLLNLNKSTWSSLKISSYKEKRGINISENRVEIQTPLKLDYLEYENVVIAGYPSFSESMKIKYKSESSHTFVKGYGVLTGKNMKQSYTVVDSAYCNFQDLKLLCKVSIGQNDSHYEEFGEYILKSYYHKDYGFVKLEYLYPSGKKIIFRLIEIENEP